MFPTEYHKYCLSQLRYGLPDLDVLTREGTPAHDFVSDVEAVGKLIEKAVETLTSEVVICHGETQASTEPAQPT